MLATFWITNECNMRCRYCYEGSNKNNKVMSKTLIDKSISYVLNQSNSLDDDELVIQIHGGEPFLEFNLIKYIISEFKNEKFNKNIIFSTTTNGMLLNNDILDFIQLYIAELTISIDGAKNTHDKNRQSINGKGTHDIVIENSRKILKIKPNVRVRMTFDTETVGNLCNDIKYLISEGFRTIVPVPDMFETRWNNNHIEVLKNQIYQIKEIIGNNKDILVSLTDTNIYKYKGVCSGGKLSFNICPDGYIYPCTLAVGNKDFSIGNIYDGIDKTNRDKFLNKSYLDNKDCKGCDLSDSCDGNRCKIINKLTRGSYFLPSPINCAIQNIKHEINISKEIVL